jgi:transcriptional regulator with XRE-family HTH domain
MGLDSGEEEEAFLPAFELHWQVESMAGYRNIGAGDLCFRAHLWRNSVSPILRDESRNTAFSTLQRLATALGVDVCDLFAIDDVISKTPLRVAIDALRRTTPNDRTTRAYNQAIDDVLALIAERWGAPRDPEDVNELALPEGEPIA